MTTSLHPSETILGAVHEYIDRGWAVMPLKSHSKEPNHNLIRRAYLDATLDIYKATRWFYQDPKANVGISCIASNLVVIDIDYRNGGAINELLPATYTVETGDGLHLYYKAHPSMRFPGTLWQGVDVKHRGYVVAAPSLHPNGKPYRVIDDRDPVAVPMQFVKKGA
jgi:hypothetical protein